MCRAREGSQRDCGTGLRFDVGLEGGVDVNWVLERDRSGGRVLVIY
jgi:hypothetical protein